MGAIHETGRVTVDAEARVESSERADAAAGRRGQLSEAPSEWSDVVKKTDVNKRVLQKYK